MIEDLKTWLDHEPFVPFRIVLSSGTSYEITTPYQLAIGKTQLDYYFPKSDRKAILRLSQITSFETLEQSAT